MAKRNRTKIYHEYEDCYDYIPHGNKYKPFISIQDVPSLGRSSRIHGIKTNRQHEFLSDLERNYFLILEYAENVIDIREQFPLELEITQLIAEELGIKHPINPKNRKPITMTSDFCITVKDDKTSENMIRTLKYKKDLLNNRVIEKFTIEQNYWNRLGIDWGIVTEEEINKIFCQNLNDILKYQNLSDNYGFQNISKEELEDLIIAFLQRLIGENQTVREIASVFEKDVHLPKGSGITLFKHLLARHYISIDLFLPLQLDQKVEIDLLVKSRELGEVFL